MEIDDVAAFARLVGVLPDVPVAPTLAALRAGHDEVPEEGLGVARAGATPP